MSQGLVPLAMLTALFAATPAPLSKRWPAWIAGVIALDLLVLVTIAVSIAFGLVAGETTSGVSVGFFFPSHSASAISTATMATNQKIERRIFMDC